MSDIEHASTETADTETIHEAGQTEDSQVIAADTAEEEDLDDLDDMEFMLDEIENRIAPLA